MPASPIGLPAATLLASLTARGGCTRAAGGPARVATRRLRACGTPDRGLGLAVCAVDSSADRRTRPEQGTRRVIAMDGKTLRGSACDAGDDGRHLPAAVTMPAASSWARPRWSEDERDFHVQCPARPHPRQRAVITADAQHNQCDHARYLAGQGAYHLLTVSAIRPPGSSISPLRSWASSATPATPPPWPPRPAPRSAHADDHEMINDFAGAMRRCLLRHSSTGRVKKSEFIQKTSW
jgi:hypothetical protein